MSCAGCNASIDCESDELFPYSLTGNSLFPYIIICPTNANCFAAPTVSMTCCGQLITAVMTNEMTQAERLARVQALVLQCRALVEGCTTPPGPDDDDPIPTPPGETIYFSNKQTARSYCAAIYDEGYYSYTVPAGSVVSDSQVSADAAAFATAQTLANSHKFCLNAPDLVACVDVETTLNINTVGGTGPFTFEIASGSLPTGLSMAMVGGVLRVTGTPTTADYEDVTVEVSDAVGGVLTKTLTFYVLEVTTAELPDFFTGVPYSQQLEGAGGSGEYLWAITAGALPAGLSMSESGLISGTPTGDTNAMFTVRMSDAELGVGTGCTAALGIGFGSRTFYYTLDSFVSNYMVNAAASPPDNNLDLPTSGAPELTIVAGKISNAVQRLTGALYALPRTRTLDSDGFGFGEYLNLSDKSWTVRFWMKHLSNMGPTEHNMIFIADINREQGVSITSYADPAEFPMCRYKAYVSNATFAAPDIELESAQIDGTTDWQQWHRVVVVYDSQAEMLKIKINNDSFETQAAPGDYSMDSISRALWAIVPVQVAFTNYVIDELAVVVGKAWTDADCTYDWNSGTGRTYPDLP